MCVYVCVCTCTYMCMDKCMYVYVSLGLSRYGHKFLGMSRFLFICSVCVCVFMSAGVIYIYIITCIYLSGCTFLHDVACLHGLLRGYLYVRLGYNVVRWVGHGVYAYCS